MTKIQVDSNGKAIMLNNKALEASGGSTLITKNITQNGTYNASSDNADGYSSVTVNVSGGSSTGEFLIRVIDYDGTVLKSERLNTGATFTLPSQPSHTGLVFDGWSSPVAVTNNTVTVTNSDITIGPMYHTSSGLSEFDITLTTVTGLSVTLNMNGTKNWGDGTSDTGTTHTYASAGDYTITCDGSTMTTSTNGGLFGQNSTPNYYVKNARFGSSVTNIGDHALWNCRSLTSITMPENITSISNNTFYACRSLIGITMPVNVTSISDYSFYLCSSLTSIAISEGMTSIGENAFHECSSLISIAIPEGITNIGNYAFDNCYSLTSITLPNSITSIGDYVFSYCYSLTKATIPEGVTSIGNSAFRSCRPLVSITLPNDVASISNNAFGGCFSIIEYDFSNCIAVPTLSNTNVFSNINQVCKIKVPASLATQWKTETNWSTYADYIVGV